MRRRKARYLWSHTRLYTFFSLDGHLPSKPNIRQEMSMKQMLIVLALAFAALPAFAAAKPKTYPASCDRVWAAVKRATAPPHYNFAMMDDAQKKGIVSTGNSLSGKRNLDITLSGVGR